MAKDTACFPIMDTYRLFGTFCPSPPYESSQRALNVQRCLYIARIDVRSREPGHPVLRDDTNPMVRTRVSETADFNNIVWKFILEISSLQKFKASQILIKF